MDRPERLIKDLMKPEKKKPKKTESQIFEKKKKETTKKVKGTTYKDKYNKKFNKGLDISNNKTKISKQTRIPKKILDEVYDRGIGAYKTNLSSVRLKGSFKKDTDMRKGASKRLSKEQWAIARVYAFVIKTLNKREPQNQDLDLIEEARKILKKKI